MYCLYCSCVTGAAGCRFCNPDAWITIKHPDHIQWMKKDQYEDILKSEIRIYITKARKFIESSKTDSDFCRSWLLTAGHELDKAEGSLKKLNCLQ